jgi:hypothetical protein
MAQGSSKGVDRWRRGSTAAGASGLGTGTSSHFACGVYAYMNTIESQVQYCNVVQSELTPEQSRCAKIGMNCGEVGTLADWGHPLENVTDTSFYFSQYLNGVDGFLNATYYDPIIMKGSFVLSL